MTRRRVARLLAAGVLLAALAVLIPGSPAYLPNLLVGPGHYGGRSTRSWIKALDSPDPELRHRAIFALGTIGAEAGAAVPALAAILAEDADAEARHQAALALAKMAPASRAALPALIGALTDSEPLVRLNAAYALTRLGEEARPAIGALGKALAHPDNQTNAGVFFPSIQELAAQALGQASAGSAEAVPALTAALSSASEATTIAAARALGQIGPAARSAVPQLRALLEGNSKEVRQAARQALRQIEGKRGAHRGPPWTAGRVRA
jgi:HEAT repeat protein